MSATLLLTREYFPPTASQKLPDARTACQSYLLQYAIHYTLNYDERAILNNNDINHSISKLHIPTPVKRHCEMHRRTVHQPVSVKESSGCDTNITMKDTTERHSVAHKEERGKKMKIKMCYQQSTSASYYLVIRNYLGDFGFSSLTLYSY